MPRLRSILSILLVLITTLLVSCSDAPKAQIPTTYSPAKIEQLQVFVEPIKEAREELSELKGYIADLNWVDTRTFIHGPLGQLRQNMLKLSRELLPRDQKEATELAKRLFGDFERIDAAAKDRNAYQAQVQFQEAIRDFDAFLDLIPKAS
ncbi:photosystem II protein PsbQ [Gloeothece citriformis PCC 7424]|uniref:Photosystem II protein PsbQ n=1 Tax=Gloeothece citriformis (strain PCC 7424) TaxID=65393 RepID=B7KAJ5_GLOC7|nr:photosystem II protein PsbQ [Gloeothece citriformis]ACK68667.1 photosystem II protein PsbQ [Gloeothece citriformis PCC 7424]